MDQLVTTDLLTTIDVRNPPCFFKIPITTTVVAVKNSGFLTSITPISTGNDAKMPEFSVSGSASSGGGSLGGDGGRQLSHNLLRSPPISVSRCIGGKSDHRMRPIADTW